MAKRRKVDMILEALLKYFGCVIELPVVELKETDNDKIWIEKYKFFWEINLKENDCIVFTIWIGKKQFIKSVAEFNEKCALLFGFYLKEV